MALVIGVLTIDVTVARATPSVATCTGEEAILAVKGDSAAYAIKMMVTGDLAVRVPRGIRSVQVESDGPLGWRRDPDQKFTAVRLFFKTGAEANDTSSVRLESFGFSVQLHVTATRDVTRATGDLRAIPIDDLQHEAAKVAALVETQVNQAAEEQRTSQRARERAMWEQVRTRAEEEEARQRLRRYKVYPDEDQEHEQTGPVFAHFLEADWENGQNYVYFTARNGAARPQPVKALTVLDAAGEPVTDVRVYFDDRSEVPPDGADEDGADDGREPSAEEQAQEERLQRVLAAGGVRVDALVDGQQSATGVIVIPAAAQRGQNPLGLRVHGIGGQVLAETILKGWKMRPVTRTEWERERRARQLSVNVRLLAGGAWLGDGAGLERFDPTVLSGVGVRFQKGYGNGIALEMEGSAIRTGQATFSNVNWDNAQGEVIRRASLARLMVGGAARLGDKYVTTLRLGIGVQVVSYDSTFNDGSGARNGPGDNVDMGGVWSVGGSFAVRLGAHWSLGVTGTFAQGVDVDSDARVVEAGLNVGYGWNP